jgi:hypothetical protein
LFKFASSTIKPTNRHWFEQISLSRKTVARRIDSIADDLKLNLTDVTKQFECFSIALDESIDSSDTAQLAIFIRGIDTNFNYVEELLSLQPMKYTTKGEDIFQEIEKAFETFKLNWEKLSGVATDGTPSMVGSKSGVIAKIQSELSSRNIKNENFLVFHCILHQVAEGVHLPPEITPRQEVCRDRMVYTPPRPPRGATGSTVSRSRLYGQIGRFRRRFICSAHRMMSP